MRLVGSGRRQDEPLGFQLSQGIVQHRPAIQCRFPDRLAPPTRGLGPIHLHLPDISALRPLTQPSPQVAWFWAAGHEQVLEALIEDLHETYPDIPVILDAKRGDIGETNKAYAQEAFERYKADAVTVSPYLGLETLQPFIAQHRQGYLCPLPHKQFPSRVAANRSNLPADSTRSRERERLRQSHAGCRSNTHALDVGRSWVKSCVAHAHVVDVQLGELDCTRRYI